MKPTWMVNRFEPSSCRDETLSVVWWGADCAEFAWLKARVRGYRSNSVLGVEVDQIEGDLDVVLQRLEQGRVDRLVRPLFNRWDYDPPQLLELAEQYPDVPVAVALSDWWLGWRRTGVGHLQTLSHLSLPWYRWWDGWVHWIEGTVSEQLGPFPQDRWLALPAAFMARIESDGVVSATEAWRQINSPNDGSIRNRIPAASCIYWDDDCLPTSRGWQASIDFAIEQLGQLQRAFPTAQLLVSWTLPSWEVVERLTAAGIQFELFAKPHLFNFSSAALART